MHKQENIAFGQTAMQMGAITQEHFQAYLKEDPQHQTYFTKWLLARGYISQEQIQAVYHNCSIPQHKTQQMQDYKAQPDKKLGRYKLLSILGQGGMGKVYRAFDPLSQRELALKVLLVGDKASKQAVNRFQREAKAMAQLNNPGIVKIYDIGETEGQLFFTMDLIKGPSLKELQAGNPLDIEQSVDFIIKVCKVMGYAHKQGIVHRDLKPANIMVYNREPVVMDFGLAKVAKASKKLSKTGVMMGTLRYMPPEQVEGKHSQVDAQSDLYAIGIILYELLARKAAFDGKSHLALVSQVLTKTPKFLCEINPKISKDLNNICFKAFARQKKHRYVDCYAFANDLENYKNQKKVEARPIKSYKPKIIFVAIILFLGLFFMFGNTEKTKPIKTTKKQKKSSQIKKQKTSSLVIYNNIIYRISKEKTKPKKISETILRPKTDQGSKRHMRDARLARTSKNELLTIIAHGSSLFIDTLQKPLKISKQMGTETAMHFSLRQVSDNTLAIVKNFEGKIGVKGWPDEYGNGLYNTMFACYDIAEKRFFHVKSRPDARVRSPIFYQNLDFIGIKEKADKIFLAKYNKEFELLDERPINVHILKDYIIPMDKKRFIMVSNFKKTFEFAREKFPAKGKQNLFIGIFKAKDFSLQSKVLIHGKSIKNYKVKVVSNGLLIAATLNGNTTFLNKIKKGRNDLWVAKYNLVKKDFDYIKRVGGAICKDIEVLANDGFVVLGTIKKQSFMARHKPDGSQMYFEKFSQRGYRVFDLFIIKNIASIIGGFEQRIPGITTSLIQYEY